MHFTGFLVKLKIVVTGNHDVPVRWKLTSDIGMVSVFLQSNHLAQALPEFLAFFWTNNEDKGQGFLICI